MISDLEVEVNELRVSIDLLTKGMGMQAKALAALTDVLREGGSLVPPSTEPAQTKAEPSPTPTPPPSVETVRSIFTKKGKDAKIRTKLIALLDEYSAKKVEEVPTEKLGEVMARAEAFEG